MSSNISNLDLNDIKQKKALLEIEEKLAINKAISSNDSNEILKAMNYVEVKYRSDSNGKALLFDPLTLSSSSQGYIDKMAKVNYNVLRNMSQVAIVRAIIDTRKEQIARFGNPQRDKYSPGFLIRKKRTMSDILYRREVQEDEKIIDELTEFVMNCGNLENRYHADSFETFLRKLSEDVLALDQGTYENVYDRSGKLVEFYATDGATFRIADTHDDDAVTRTNYEKIKGHYPSYVQILNGQPIECFYPWELGWVTRNPQTDIYSNGYGKSELEYLIRTITSILNADTHNDNIFKVGSHPKGILKVQGLNQTKVNEFRTQWLAEVAGAANSHKIPVINADKMDFIPTQMSNRDMEYSRYQEFLIKVCCAVYKISPEEVGMPIEGMYKATLGKGNNDNELEYSRDKGLKPVLRLLERHFTKSWIEPLAPGYEFAFVGVDAESEQEEEERLVEACKTYMEINEVRAVRGLSPKEGYDIILNPIISDMRMNALNPDPELQQFAQAFNGGAGDAKSSDPKGGGKPPVDQELPNPMLKSLNNFIDRINHED